MKLEHIVIPMIIVYTVIALVTSNDQWLVIIFLTIIFSIRMIIWWFKRGKVKPSKESG